MHYRDEDVRDVAKSIFDRYGHSGTSHIANEIATAFIQGSLEELVWWLGVSKRFAELISPDGE